MVDVLGSIAATEARRLNSSFGSRGLWWAEGRGFFGHGCMVDGGFPVLASRGRISKCRNFCVSADSQSVTKCGKKLFRSPTPTFPSQICCTFHSQFDEGSWELHQFHHAAAGVGASKVLRIGPWNHKHHRLWLSCVAFKFGPRQPMTFLVAVDFYLPPSIWIRYQDPFPMISKPNTRHSSLYATVPQARTPRRPPFSALRAKLRRRVMCCAWLQALVGKWCTFDGPC